MSDAPSPPSGTHGLAVGNVLKRQANGSYHVEEDQVSLEEPLEIRIDDQPLAVTMRTPGEDQELAAGFLFTEGIVRSPDDVSFLPPLPQDPNRIRLRLHHEHDLPDPQLQRYGTIQASCGICGTTSIESILKRLPPLDPKQGPQIAEQILLHLPEKMRQAQAQFAHSGGLHASAVFDATGDICCLREDIGRHNALDKIAGWALLNRFLPLDRQLLLLSGRTSFELVQKALALRIPLIAGISAPSSLAVNFARDAGITLLGFLRDNRFNCYTHPQRLSR